MPADPRSVFNLERLRKDAKRLLRACRAKDAHALSRVQASLSRLRALDASVAARTITLADVHQAFALERGFANWGDLTRLGDPTARLLTAVRGGHVAAFRRDVRVFSGLAPSNILAASALGDARALTDHVARDPTAVTTRHDGWAPLDYVCSSPLARLSTRHATSLCDCAEILLAGGADPRTAVDDGRIATTPPLPIARAMLSGNPSLVVILKRYGAQEPHEALVQWAAANADGDQAKLHHVFGEYFRRPEVRERFKQGFAEFRARGGEHTPMPSDPRERQHLRMPNLIGADPHLWSAMLDRGWDPTATGTNGRSALHTLATYAPAAIVEIFLQRGIDVRARDADGRSVVATAVRAGNLSVADLLRAQGVEDDSTAMDTWLGLCLIGEAEAAQDLVADHPDLFDTIARADADEFVRAAARGNIDQVRLMLACGFPPDSVGESGATALQQAAWRGQVAVVEVLLANGASLLVRDDLYGESAFEWAHHGASHAHGAEGPCLEAARLIANAAAR
jgi:ankyrin repeat protein